MSININHKQLAALFGSSAPSRARSRTPGASARSRSRSKSGGRSRSNSAPKKARARTRVVKIARRTADSHALMTHILKNIAPVHSNIQMLKKKIALANVSYFSKDAKDVKAPDVSQMQKDLEQLTKEFELLKGTMRAGLKDKPIRMRLSQSFVLTTTVTTGVTKTVNMAGTGNSDLMASNCTEFSTLTALFDEYKVLGGECDFNYLNSAAANASITSDSVPVIGFDVDTSSGATSSLSLTQLSQHKTLPIWGGFSNNGTTFPLHHRFSWHVPHGTAAGATGVIVPGTQWIASALTATSGYLRFYHVGSVITAIDTGAGFCYFDTEWRCRS